MVLRMDAWWYQISVFVHILCAVVWTGGLLFIVMVLAPLLRMEDFRPQAARVLETAGRKFQRVAWWCFAGLLLTGSLNAGARWGFANLKTAEFWRAEFPGALLKHKLLLFVLVLCLSYLHDFIVGPRAVAAMRAAAEAPETLRLRRMAAWMGRMNLLLALAILWAAVQLVRG